MNKYCVTCKYWTPNFLKEPMCGDTFCENQQLKSMILSNETDTPGWVKTRIVTHFYCNHSFGCLLWEDSELIWGRIKDEPK